MVRKLEVKSNLEQIIEKGGSVSADKDFESTNEWKNVLLRITKDLLESVDQKVKLRVGMNRTAWILEAVQEKLKRELELSS